MPLPPPPPVEPLDEFNRRLLENVHPPDWINPVPRERYHLVVIGAGTAGLVSAAGAAGLGARVALIERHLMGGDCLNVGCVPSKAIIRAARAWRGAADARSAFGGPAVQGGDEFGAVMARMRELRARLSLIDGAPRFRGLGVDVFLGEGCFVAPDRIAVGESVLRFRRAIIATGARAAVPAIPGLVEAGYRTNETIFNLTERPRRLIVIGGGPIGCELGQAFARLGSAVTLINRGAGVLPREDRDAAELVERAMLRDGVTLLQQATVLRFERDGSAPVVVVVRAGREERILGDVLLVAVGRTPNIEGLGLEAAGVRTGPSGIAVDDRLRTANPRVFAIGDVATQLRFTHHSDFQARLAIENALFFGRRRASRLVVPRCTYTSPEVAHIGLSGVEARSAAQTVDTLTIPLAEVDRAVLDGESEGFFRIYVERGSGRILGATLVAAHAGDMISEIGVAMVNGVGLDGIGRTIHPYPTQAEVFRRAADAWQRRRLTPRARRFLALFFRVFR